MKKNNLILFIIPVLLFSACNNLWQVAVNGWTTVSIDLPPSVMQTSILLNVVDPNTEKSDLVTQTATEVTVSLYKAKTNTLIENKTISITNTTSNSVTFKNLDILGDEIFAQIEYKKFASEDIFVPQVGRSNDIKIKKGSNTLAIKNIESVLLVKAGITENENENGSKTAPFSSVHKAIERVLILSEKGINSATIELLGTDNIAGIDNYSAIIPTGVTITLKGDGTVTAKNSTNSNPLYNVEGTLNLDGVILQGSSSMDSVISVASGATLTMKKGSIMGENTGIANMGNFTMTGGIITNNTIGVSNDANGTFIMAGGDISNNSQTGVNNIDGTFTMGGGNISRNGLGVDNKASFSISNGKISNNNYGGGVKSTKTMVMTGGSIEYNNYQGVLLETGTFTMHNGSIQGNQGEVGGVYVKAETVFTMNNGRIIYNTGSPSQYSAGGVYLAGTLIMNGGCIQHNTGGLDMDQTSFGGGINVIDGSTLKLSGNVKISNNKLKDYASETPKVVTTDNNICLSNTATSIIIPSPLTDGAEIWVTPRNQLGSKIAIPVTGPVYPYLGDNEKKRFRNDITKANEGFYIGRGELNYKEPSSDPEP